MAINTLSGAIDLFNANGSIILTESMSDNNFENLPESLFNFLVKRGYIFPSAGVEELVFDTFLNDTKKRKYSTDKVLGFFDLDTNCPMGYEYCFEKKAQQQNENFEKSIMNESSIASAFEFLNMVKTIQGKEIDFVARWGGEPLQENNFEINKIFLDYACKYNLPVAYFQT